VNRGQILHDIGGTVTIGKIVAARHDDHSTVRLAGALCLCQQAAQPALFVQCIHVQRCGPTLTAFVVTVNL
jgi:hypothetical protein